MDECVSDKSVCKVESEECINTVGSYKCVIKVKKTTKVLQIDDYDAENDDEDDYDEEGITEIPDYEGKCEEGFKLNENGKCIGKL